MGKNNSMMMVTIIFIGVIIAVGIIIAGQRNIVIDQLANNFYGNYTLQNVTVTNGHFTDIFVSNEIWYHGGNYTAYILGKVPPSNINGTLVSPTQITTNRLTFNITNPDAYLYHSGANQISLGGGDSFGSTTFTGNITIGANRLKTNNILIKDGGGSSIVLRDIADANNGDLTLGRITVTDHIYMITDGMNIRGRDADDGYFTILGRDNGVGMVETARVQGAVEPYFRFGTVDYSVKMPSETAGIIFGDRTNSWDLMLSVTDENLLALTNTAKNTYKGFQVSLLYASNEIILENGAVIETSNVDDFYYKFFARDNGVGRVEVARVQSASDPNFSLGGGQQFKFYASGYLEAQNINFVDGTGINSAYGNDTTVIFQGFNNGVGRVEVARIQGGLNALFTFGGSQQFKFSNSGVATLTGTVNMPYYSADYGLTWTGLPNPTGTVNGGMMTVYNSNAGILASRLYIYTGSAWHYVVIT